MRKRLILLISVSVMVAAGCKVNPTPPSEEDAKTTWNHIHKQLGLSGDTQLVDLKRTDGRFAEVNGVKVYTLFYEARRGTSRKWDTGSLGT